MNIRLTSEKPVNLKPHRPPFARRPIMRKLIDELLEADIIRHSESPYASPALLVPKKNNEFRLCVDFRQLNRITVKQPYPMPNMEELLVQLSGNCYFTKLDMNMGYQQIEMEDEAKALTAFVTIEGHYEYQRMPFGLTNAPAVFQEMMNIFIRKLPPNTAVCYLDDVVIYSKTKAEGIAKLELFLDAVESAGLTLNREKCQFLETKINFLGYRVSGDGIEPGLNKLQAITEFKKPENATEVRRFLGLTGFFRKFVKDYSLITKPLTDLTKKDVKFNWEKPQTQAFETLINNLTNSPILDLYNYSSLHEVHTDASSVGLAAVLLQSRDDGRTWKAVMYFSRHCTDAETRYHSYELELLAVVEALQRFRVYVLGKHFKVVTDCSAITAMIETTPMIPRVARWWLKLQEYTFDRVHRAGAKMQHVDALSRAPITEHAIINNSSSNVYLPPPD